MRKPFVFVLLLVLAWSCQNSQGSHPKARSPGAAAPSSEQAARAEPSLAALSDGDFELKEFEHTYGIYMNGIKVGWMQSRLRIDSLVHLETQLNASIGGMGQVSSIIIDESRAYDPKDKTLQSLTFGQRAATGRVMVTGRRADDGGFVLDISAGDTTQTQEVPEVETLDDAIAVHRLVTVGSKVGASVSVKHFDASLQRVVEVEHRVDGSERRMFGGVETEVVKLHSTYPALGVSETSFFDAHGKMLESQVGGFFVARLEPPEVAKQIDYQQDLLVSAVVKTPKPIKKPASIQSLELAFTGFGTMLPPSSPFQKVEQRGDMVHLVLTRPPALPKSPLKDMRQGVDALPSEVQEGLMATPFIQSEDPRLVGKAKEVVGDAEDMATAIERLTHFVADHVKDEYVPAYSNALEALTSGRGDCTEHSVLFVGLARALGLPARVAVGIAYWPAGGGFGWHAWSEVFVDGTWYPVDPTWNQPIADATHVKLADGGPAEQARIVMLLGELRIKDLRIGG